MRSKASLVAAISVARKIPVASRLALIRSSATHRGYAFPGSWDLY